MPFKNIKQFIILKLFIIIYYKYGPLHFKYDNHSTYAGY